MDKGDLTEVVTFELRPTGGRWLNYVSGSLDEVCITQQQQLVQRSWGRTLPCCRDREEAVWMEQSE